MIRSERGMTLIELMIGATLMIVVLGSSIAVFAGYERTTADNGRLNDSLERARVAVDQLARDLRNGTTPSPEQPNAIEKAQPYDLVTQTVDDVNPAGNLNTRNVKRVRYCLDSTVPDDGRLWYQTQSWTGAVPPALPSTASCPDNAWGNQRAVATKVVNRRDGTPVWSFNSATLALVTRIRMELVVDINSAAARPRASRIASAVFMRNQNRPPVAAFQATPTGNGTVHLNATASSDPEGERLSYQWFDGSTPVSQSGIAVNFAPEAPGPHTIKLKVYDPSGLYATTEQTVMVP